jgi:hypothetical protein
MSRCPKRLAWSLPLRTHLPTVATEISSSLATSFGVMYLFVMVFIAIYVSNDFSDCTVPCESDWTVLRGG